MANMRGPVRTPQGYPWGGPLGLPIFAIFVQIFNYSSKELNLKITKYGLVMRGPGGAPYLAKYGSHICKYWSIFGQDPY